MKPIFSRPAFVLIAIGLSAAPLSLASADQFGQPFDQWDQISDEAFERLRAEKLRFEEQERLTRIELKNRLDAEQELRRRVLAACEERRKRALSVEHALERSAVPLRPQSEAERLRLARIEHALERSAVSFRDRTAAEKLRDARLEHERERTAGPFRPEPC